MGFRSIWFTVGNCLHVLSSFEGADPGNVGAALKDVLGL